MDKPLEIFKRLGKSHGDGEEYVMFSLDLRKPVEFGYTIRGFLDEEEDTDAAVFRKKISMLQGVDSNFSFEMNGKVSGPEEFSEAYCIVMVNPLAGSDYVEYAMRGYIGDGWFGTDSFLFRLYISPMMAKDFLDRRLMAERVEAYYREEEDSSIWMTLRLDVIDYKYIEISRDNNPGVSYKITRLYS